METLLHLLPGLLIIITGTLFVMYMMIRDKKRWANSVQGRDESFALAKDITYRLIFQGYNHDPNKEGVRFKAIRLVRDISGRGVTLSRHLVDDCSPVCIKAGLSISQLINIIEKQKLLDDHDLYWEVGIEYVDGKGKHRYVRQDIHKFVDG